MPLFEFTCSKCNHKFELLVFDSSIDEAKCPKCGSIDAKKQFSSFASVSSQSNSNCPAASFCPSADGSHKCSCACRH